MTTPPSASKQEQNSKRRKKRITEALDICCQQSAPDLMRKKKDHHLHLHTSSSSSRSVGIGSDRRDSTFTLNSSSHSHSNPNSGFFGSSPIKQAFDANRRKLMRGNIIVRVQGFEQRCSVNSTNYLASRNNNDNDESSSSSWNDGSHIGDGGPPTMATPRKRTPRPSLVDRFQVFERNSPCNSLANTTTTTTTTAKDDDESSSSLYEDTISHSSDVGPLSPTLLKTKMVSPRKPRVTRPLLIGLIQQFDSPSRVSSTITTPTPTPPSLVRRISQFDSPTEVRALLKADSIERHGSSLVHSIVNQSLETSENEVTEWTTTPAWEPAASSRESVSAKKDRCRNAPSRNIVAKIRQRPSSAAFNNRGPEITTSQQQQPANVDVLKEVRAPRMDFSDFVPPVYNDPPKTFAQKELIKNAVEKYFVFEEFKTNNSSTHRLAKAFESIQVAAGETIMRQDQDNQEGHFYIVEQGRVEFQCYGITVGCANEGECFGEEALRHHSAPNATAVAVMPLNETYEDDGTNDHEDGGVLSSAVKLLRLDQKSFRGILHNHTVQAECDKLNLIEYVDVLQDLLEKDKALVARLTSIMSRHGFTSDQEIKVNPDDTFYIVQEGTLEITGKGMDVILRSGDYLGERALTGSSFSRNGKASSQTMTGMLDGGSYYTIDRATMEKVLGPGRLRKLKDCLKLVRPSPRFRMAGHGRKKLLFSRGYCFSEFGLTLSFVLFLQADVPFLRNADLNPKAMDALVDNIVETAYEEGQDILKSEEDGKPALYIVREGTVTISSTDNDDGVLTKEVCAGEVFGVDELTAGMPSGDDGGSHFSSRLRRVGMTAMSTGERPCICGVLSLDELKNAQGIKEEKKEHQVLVQDSAVLQRREEVRISVRSKIKFEDLERISLLGEGQFGEVWLVTANVLQTGIDALKQKFALKSQFKLDDIRDDATENIQREIQMLQAMHHTGIVDLVTTYEDETSIHMLMGLITGGELWNVIHKEDDDGNWSSGIAEDPAKFYCLVVADTLAYMHSQMYVFRDLKPENVMIDAEGYPVIVDFGFAKHCPDNKKTHTFCGTPNYVAPEIVKNVGHNSGADDWALGVMLYEVICGENPFYCDGMDQLALFEAICHEKYYPFPTEPSKELIDLVDGLLEKDPAQRLGMLARGSEDILQHKWFDGMDLAKLRAREVRAPSRPAQQAEDDFGDEELDDTQAQIVREEPNKEGPSCSVLLNLAPPITFDSSLRDLHMHEIDEKEEEAENSGSASHVTLPSSPPAAKKKSLQPNLPPKRSPKITKEDKEKSKERIKQDKEKSKERRTTIIEACPLLAYLDAMDEMNDLDF
jgi:protein kinase A